MKEYAAICIHQPKFTPGPWRVRFCRDNNTTYPQWVARAEKPYDPVLNAGAFSRPASEVAIANAHLIAAAPDLHQALTEAEACMSIVEPRSDKAEYLRILGVVRAALAKAEVR